MKSVKTQGIISILLVLIALFSTRINSIYSGSNENNTIELEPNDVYYLETTSFYFFNLEDDDPELISVKANPYINFSYSGGSSSPYASDVYHYDLAEAAETDFYIELNVMYNYTGTTLAEFFVRLESDYAEDGSLAGSSWEHRITQNIIYDVSDVEDLDCWVIGHPFDGYDEYSETGGTITNPGFFVFRIGRQNGGVLCEIENMPDYYLSHLWSNGLAKPLNSIYIGGIIYPVNDSKVDVSFTDFFARFKYGEEQTSPNPTTGTTPSTTTSNPNETMPFWFWIIIGGAFTIAIALPITINIIMKKKVQ